MWVKRFDDRLNLIDKVDDLNELSILDPLNPTRRAITEVIKEMNFEDHPLIVKQQI